MGWLIGNGMSVKWNVSWWFKGTMCH